MTSSDDVVMTPGAVDALAAKVGRSQQGRPARAVALGVRVALVCAKFNGLVSERLAGGALRALAEAGVEASAVEVAWVPGAFELPLAAARLARSGRVDALVALGAVIRGETAHFEFVAGQCAAGLQRVALDSGVPVAFGVLTVDELSQALARSGEGPDNKGYEAAITALEMVDLLGALTTAPV